MKFYFIIVFITLFQNNISGLLDKRRKDLITESSVPILNVNRSSTVYRYLIVKHFITMGNYNLLLKSRGILNIYYIIHV